MMKRERLLLRKSKMVMVFEEGNDDGDECGGKIRK